MNRFGNLLRTNKAVQVGEIITVFLVALVIMTIFVPMAGENLVVRQAVVWTANVFMLIVVWLGLWLRGESWKSLGLTFRFHGWKPVLSAFWKSLVVFVAAAFAFFLGSAIMINITGIPQGAEMGSYEYLRGNLPMLLLTLMGVYVVSSFGEEVIYRGFLITRLETLGGGGKWALRIAVIVSAIIFGLIHFDWGIVGVVQTGFMGLALGISYLVVRRRLWILVLAHAYLDTILMVQLYVPLE